MNLLKNIYRFILRKCRVIYWKNKKNFILNPNDFANKAEEEFWQSINKYFSSNKIEKFKLVEVGCGCGEASIFISKNFPSSQIIGFDLNKNQIRIGNKFINEHKLKNIQLKIGNINDLNSELVCDYFVSSASLIYLSDVEILKLFIKLNDKVRLGILLNEIMSDDEMQTSHIYIHNYRDIMKKTKIEINFEVTYEKLDYAPWKGINYSGYRIFCKRKLI